MMRLTTGLRKPWVVRYRNEWWEIWLCRADLGTIEYQRLGRFTSLSLALAQIEVWYKHNRIVINALAAYPIPF